MRIPLLCLALLATACGGTAPGGLPSPPDGGMEPPRPDTDGGGPLPPMPCDESSTCDDGIDCTVDTCDEATGFCTHTAEDSLCDNDEVCDGTETCDPTSGCIMGEPPQIEECINVSAQLVSGVYHSCYVSHVGRLYCWGFGAEGQLGYGYDADNLNVGDNEHPADVGYVLMGDRFVAQVAPGTNHTCILTINGNVMCWGEAGEGQLGYGNTLQLYEPKIPGQGGDDPSDPSDPVDDADVNVDIGGIAVQIASKFTHSCALLDGGQVRCWGRGADGQLGYGRCNPDDNAYCTVGDDETPASVGDVPLGGNAVQVATGGNHTCALLDTGGVRCWGRGSEGQLGYASTEDVGDDEVPAEQGDIDLGGNAVQITAGGNHTCALLDSGNVRCWGDGATGRLGYGNTSIIGDNEHPSAAGDIDLGGPAVQVAAGSEHTCALLQGGTVRCWGNGQYGRLGYGNTRIIGDGETPREAGDIALGGPAEYISAGRDFTCAILNSGAVRCWGNGASGRLGYGNRDIIGDDEDPEEAGDIDLIPAEDP